MVLASRQYSARLELFSSLARADDVGEVGSAAHSVPELNLKRFSTWNTYPYPVGGPLLRCGSP